MIYDTFPFNDELSLLEARLRHQTFVDRFVVVESPKTFTGRPKPLHFQENKARFKEWEDKIIHLVVDGPTDPNPWVLEARQRDAFITMLPRLKDDDIVLLLDVDEFLSEAILTRFLPSKEMTVTPEMVCLVYYANCRAGGWSNGRITRACEIYKRSATVMRQQEHYHEKWQDGGWHFSYMVLNDPSRLVRKLESFCHREYDTHHHKANIIKGCAELRAYTHPHIVFPVVPLNDPSLPPWLHQNKDWFEREGWVKPYQQAIPGESPLQS